MSPTEFTRLSRQLSLVIYPYLDRLLRGENLPPFLPGVDQVLAIWQYLSTPIQADRKIKLRLEEVNFRTDQPRPG